MIIEGLFFSWVLLEKLVSAVAVSGPPNVLLIVVDDLKPVVGAYGDAQAFTPNMDSLAERGTVFTNTFVQQAVCGPSRTSFLTSRRPDRTRLYDFGSYWRDHSNFTTLPQYFKENGYTTLSMGKVFHPGKCSNKSDDMPYSWSHTPYHPPTQVYMNSAVCLEDDGRLHANLYCPVVVEDQPGHSLPDIQIADTAVKFLNNYKTDKKNKEKKSPFFLAVGFHKPHVPLKFPVEFLDFHPLHHILPANQSTRPSGLPAIAWNPWHDIRKRDDIAASHTAWPWGPMEPNMARLVKQGYYAAVSYIDHQIGRVLSAVPGNTLVLLTGDHGWSLGEHGEWAKFSLFEEATRVPLIVVPPSPSFVFPQKEGMTQAARDCQNSVLDTTTCINRIRPLRTTRINYVETPVELVDLFPSLVQLAGLPSIPPCPYNSSGEMLCTEGKSWARLLSKNNGNLTIGDGHGHGDGHGNDRDDGDGDEGMVFSQYPRPSLLPQDNSDLPDADDIKYMGYSLRTKKYRCNYWIRFSAIPVPVPDWENIVAKELYMHDVDSGENINRALDVQYQNIMGECRTILKQYTQQYI